MPYYPGQEMMAWYWGSKVEMRERLGEAVELELGSDSAGIIS